MSSFSRIVTASSSKKTFQLHSALAARASTQLETSLFTAKKNTVRLLWNVDGVKEGILGVVGVAVRKIMELDSKFSHAISFDGPDASQQPGLLPQGQQNVYKYLAEGATLACFSFDMHKAHDKQSAPVSVSSSPTTKAAKQGWREGEIWGQAQNLARNLQETPANLLTPQLFCDRASELFASSDSVEVLVRDRAWCEEQKMGAFLSVSNGGRAAGEPLRFLEIHYHGHPEGPSRAPLGLVGKGVTFDSGGISIKPSDNMAAMKGDMGGAACVLSTMWGISQLALPVNVVACIPLTENMPSGTATKPGDLVVAANGLSIEVDNTDAEGRLILADALHYLSSTYHPTSLVELSTLTGSMSVALGEGYAGVFATCDSLWTKLDKAGKESGDEFWRMPLSEVYASQITSTVADLKNVGGRGAGACTAALFLKSFVPAALPFAHIDIAGVMQTKSSGLLSPGMSGRPVRSLLEYIKAECAQ
ncbi:hypothetical protein HDV03_004027 [Kappamyces sp. JEL0829]|nr:hypothetical protein HDV03_004027 [Kappamyces sp. JEL0829]